MDARLFKDFARTDPASPPPAPIPGVADGEEERVIVAYLNDKGEIAHILSRSDARAREVALPLRAIVREALNRGHDRFLLLHNHPSGDPRPSRADIAATKLVCRVASALGLELVDHLILARGASFSFRMSGLL